MNKDNIAIWLKKTKTDETLLSVSVEIAGEKHRFNAFRNKQKNREDPNDKRPDYRGDKWEEKT